MATNIPWQESSKPFIERIHIYDKFKEHAAKFVNKDNNQKDLEVIGKLSLDDQKQKIIIKWHRKPIAEIPLNDDEIEICKELIHDQNQTTALLNHEHSSGVIKTLSEALLFRMRLGHQAKQFLIKISVDLGSF